MLSSQQLPPAPPVPHRALSLREFSSSTKPQSSGAAILKDLLLIRISETSCGVRHGQGRDTAGVLALRSKVPFLGDSLRLAFQSHQRDKVQVLRTFPT